MTAVAIMARLCSLTVLSICSRSSENRTIPLSAIAERTRLPVEDVEYLLMKSLSVSPAIQKPCLSLFVFVAFHQHIAVFFLQARLIEGIIDQVDGTVHVSWVQPRILGIDQVKSLRDRLDTWVGKVHTALLSVEAETPDLVSSWCSSLSAQRIALAFPDVMGEDLEYLSVLRLQ